MPFSTALIQHPSYPVDFLITDTPTDDRIEEYISLLKDHKVSAVVRLCEPQYSVEKVEEQEIQVTDEFKFDDGDVPSRELIDKFIPYVDSQSGCVAVHCVSGIGRAPLFVALCILGNSKEKPESVIEFIRDRRRGAFNTKQLHFLLDKKYEKKKGLKSLFKRKS